MGSEICSQTHTGAPQRNAMTRSIHSTISGEAKDRPAGLRPLLERANGKSILDIGTFNGLIPYEFAKNDPRIIHGIDFFEQGIKAARTIFDDCNLESEFFIYDLSLGKDRFKADFKGKLLESYDIVLLLAIYHKLARQMPEKELDELMNYLISLSDQYIAARTPNIGPLDELIRESGFELVYLDGFNNKLAPLHVYEKKKNKETN